MNEEKLMEGVKMVKKKPVRKVRKHVRKVKWGKIGAPKSAKRRAFLKSVRKNKKRGGK